MPNDGFRYLYLLCLLISYCDFNWLGVFLVLELEILKL